MKEKRIFHIELVQYVPYQLCPLCEGKDSLCKVCKGERIIPMHVVRKQTIEEVTSTYGETQHGDLVSPPRKIKDD